MSLNALKYRLPVLIFAMISVGCVSTQETASMRHSLAMLHDRVVNLEKRVDSMGETQSRQINAAELYARLDEMQVRLGAMNGRLEELEHRIGRMAAASRDAGEQSVTGARPSPDNQEAFVSISPLGGGGLPPSSPPVVQQPAAPPAPPPVDPERAHFDKADQLFQEKKFAAAGKEYEAFAKKYPRSELADNALYAAGEAYFAQKQYRQAIDLFQQVLDKYPDGDRVPHSLLKQGMAFQAMGDRTAARILYQRVVQRFPNSSQARVAQSKLSEL